MRTVPLAAIQAPKAPIRREFPEAELDELAASIREKGVLQPLLVRPAGAEFELIAGTRRWHATRRAGLLEVPVIVRQVSDTEAVEIALIENLQREDLSPIEEAEGYRRLTEEFGLTQEALAPIVAKSRSHVAHRMQLLSLPDAVRRLVESGDLPVSHAYALVNAPDPVALAEEVIRAGLKLEQVERLVRRRTKHAPIRRRSHDAHAARLERELSDLLKVHCTIAEKRADRGIIQLHYRGAAQREQIVEMLRGLPRPLAVA
jgi:ParB family chromosome partitioning protein